MAKRFTCTVPSLKGVVYTIEIWDTAFSGSPTLFNVSSRLFEQRISGEGEKKTTRIMGGELTFDMLIENSTQAQIISDLRTSKEDQFTLRVTTGTGTPTVFWTGVIIADNTEQEDADYPYQFTIKAICGLGMLKKIPYYNNGTLYTGVKTFVEHLKNIFTKIPSSALYATGEELFRTSIDWWDENVTPANGTDPLGQYGVDHIVFYDFKTSGGIDEDVLDCYEVLDNILTTFDARAMMVDGVYWIEQPSYRTGNYVGRKYDKTGALLTWTGYAGVNTLNRTQSGARNSGQGGIFDYFPALKKVIVKYNVFNRRNLYTLGQIVSNPYGGSFAGGQFTHEIDSSGGNSVVKLTGDLSCQVINQSYSGNTNNTLYAVFKVQLRIGLRYWVNTFTKDIPGNKINYSAGSWSATAGYFYFHIPINPIPSSNVGLGTTINILTQPLVQDGGDNLVTLELHSIEKAWEAGNISTSVVSVYYQLPNVWLELYDQGTPDAKEDVIQYTATGDTGNTVVETYETRIGTGTSTNSVGRVRRKVGANWVVTGNWGIGVEAKDKKLGDLLALTILRGQYTPIRKMRTTAYGTIVLYRRMTTDGANWLFQGGTWRASDDELSGDFFEINYGTGGVSSTPVKVLILGNYQLPVFVGGGNASPGNSNPLTSGNPGFGVAPPPAVLYPVANNSLSAPANKGAITSLPVVTALTGNDYAINDVITIVNPVTGQFDSLTITAGPTAGATAMAVSGTLTADYPQGSYLIKKPIAYAFSLPTTTKGSVLRYSRSNTKWEAYDGATNGHVLTWNSSTNDWEASAPASGYTDEQAQDAVGGILADTATIDFTYNDATPSITADVKANAISNSLFRKSAALSVVGNASNTNPADVADITAASDGQVLRRSGTALGFGAINLASTNAITGTLPVGNGGTGLTALGTARQLLRTNAAANALEYFTFAGLTGSLTTGRVPFASGGSVLDDDAELTWDDTNKRLIIGSGTSAAQLNLFPSATSGTIENIRASGNTSGAMKWSLWNAWNSSNLGASYLQILTGNGTNGTGAGDPYILFQSGTTGSYVRYAMGIDRSDAGSFKIGRGQDTLGSATSSSFVITNAASPNYGFNIDVPNDTVHVGGRVRALNFYNTVGTPTIALGAGAGTGASATIGGGPNFMAINLTTGTSPALSGIIFTVTFSNAFAGGNQILLMDGGGTYRDNYARFYTETISASAAVVRNRVTALPAGTLFTIYLFAGAWSN